MRRTIALAALLALPVGLLAACGGDDSGDDDAQPAPEGAVVVDAKDSLEFDSDTYSADAGEVTFVYHNEGSLPHTLLIDGVDADQFKLEIGGTDQGSIDLEPGDYIIYCDIPGHRAAGMEASLTVE